MPKRDEAYMEAQREQLARAALKVLLEGGVNAASLRRISKEAGVSLGALYIHFKTREDLIAAACAVDHEELSRLPPATHWDEYVARFFPAKEMIGDRRYMNRMRLSLQFVAEIIGMSENPKGLSSIYMTHRHQLKGDIGALHKKGEIALPFGLERTVELHMQLFAGAHYQLASDHNLHHQDVFDILSDGLAVTAGRLLPKKRKKRQ